MTINLTAMTNRQQMDNVLRRIERVNHAVISYPEAKAIASRQSVVWKSRKADAHFVDFILDAPTNRQRKLEEGGIKPGVRDLERRGHSKASRFAHARLKPFF